MYTVTDGSGNYGIAGPINTNSIEGIFVQKVLVPFLAMMQQTNLFGYLSSFSDPNLNPPSFNPTFVGYNGGTIFTPPAPGGGNPPTPEPWLIVTATGGFYITALAYSGVGAAQTLANGWFVV